MDKDKTEESLFLPKGEITILFLLRGYNY